MEMFSVQVLGVTLSNTLKVQWWGLWGHYVRLTAQALPAQRAFTSGNVSGWLHACLGY